MKMYAFVDVEQYQIVGTGQTIDEARKNYRTALNLEDVETGGSMDTLEKTGTVDAVASVVVSGNTCYYFTLTGSDTVYAAMVTLNENLPFLESGNRISFTYTEDEKPAAVAEITEIKKQ